MKNRFQASRVHNGAALTTLILSAWTVFGASFTEWQQRAPVEVATPGLTRRALSPAILDASRHDLEDLRLADPNGTEVSFLLQRPSPEGATARAPKSFRPQLRGSTTTLTIETGLEMAIAAVTLETPERTFIKAVRLEGSKDARTFSPLAEGVPLFRQGGGSDLTVRVPPGIWPWLRLTVDDERSRPVPFTGALLHVARLEVLPVEPVVATIKSRDEADGDTRLVLDLDAANLALAEVEFDTTEPLFQRQVSVRVAELVGEELRENELASGMIYAVDAGVGTATRRTKIPIERRVRTRELIIVIANGNSPPLPLSAVRAFRRPIHALFQAKSPGAHTVFTGNSQCPPPRYDLGGLTVQLKKAQSTTATSGILMANPDHRKPDTLPGLAESGAPLDPKDWGFRKPISLQLPGVQQLELDLDVLAHARADLADLRLVREGQQIPYLVERPSLSRRIEPSVKQEKDQKRPAVSRWELTLSHANLPLTRLECRPRTPLFRRSVRVFELASDGRGGKYERSLGSTEWQRTAESKETQFTVKFDAHPQTSTLFLETDNGDNPPLELEGFKFVYPATRLVFKAADAPVLYYGNANVNAPRYDVALVARQLLAAGKSAATPGAEQALKKADWSQGEPLSGVRGWIFWGILAAVVIGLLAVIAKMLPKPSA